MSLRQERLKWLSEQIHHECKEMKEVLDRFPIKQVKDYKRYNFDESNKMKVKGKNMSMTELVDFILTVYKRLRKISLYTTWAMLDRQIDFDYINEEELGLIMPKKLMTEYTARSKMSSISH